MKNLKVPLSIISISLLMSACNTTNNIPIMSPPASIFQQTSLSGHAYATPSKIIPNAVIKITELDGKILAQFVADKTGYFTVDSVKLNVSAPFLITAEGSISGNNIQTKRVIDAADYLDSLDINVITTLAADEFVSGKIDIDTAFDQAAAKIGLEISGADLRTDSYFIDLADLDTSQFQNNSFKTSKESEIAMQYITSSKQTLKFQAIPSKTYRTLLKSALLKGISAAVGDEIVDFAEPYLGEYIDGFLNIEDPQVTLDDIVSAIGQLRADIRSDSAGRIVNKNLDRLRKQSDLFYSLMKIEVERERLLKTSPEKISVISVESDYEALKENFTTIQDMLLSDKNYLGVYAEALTPSSDAARVRGVISPSGIIESYLAYRVLDNANEYFGPNIKGYFTNSSDLKNRYLIIDDEDSVESTALFRSKISEQAYLISKTHDLMRKFYDYTQNRGALYRYASEPGNSEVLRELNSKKPLFKIQDSAFISSSYGDLKSKFKNSLERYKTAFPYFLNAEYTIKLDTETYRQEFVNYFPANVRSNANSLKIQGYSVGIPFSIPNRKTYPAVVIDTKLNQAAVWACLHAAYYSENTIFRYPSDSSFFEKENTELGVTEKALGSIAVNGWKRPDARIVKSKAESGDYEVNPFISEKLIERTCGSSLLSIDGNAKTAVLLSSRSKYEGSITEITKNGLRGVLKLDHDLRDNNIKAHISSVARHVDILGDSVMMDTGYNIVIPAFLPYTAVPFLK